jgi:lysocardiolipin and lysophospholipid acyltransferase
MHGHIFIILKESLKYLPVLGQGMMFFGFIFMSRKFDKDKPRIAHRLATLKSKHNGPLSGPKGLDPMWLLVFPEGTNVSENTRANSAKWAAKKGMPDFIHQVMPRSTGMFFVLNELKGTMDYVYDVTVGYEGVAYVPRLLAARVVANWR